MLRINNPRSILALAILMACKSEKPTIPEASRIVHEMGQAGVDTSDVALKQIPGEFYSEDVTQKLAKLEVSGFGAYDCSTRLFKLNARGEEILQELVGRGISWQEATAPRT